jgi:hypothetical protein
MVDEDVLREHSVVDVVSRRNNDVPNMLHLVVLHHTLTAAGRRVVGCIHDIFNGRTPRSCSFVVPDDVMYTIGSFLTHSEARCMSASCGRFRQYWRAEGLFIHPWVQDNIWCQGMVCQHRIVAHTLEPLLVESRYTQSIVHSTYTFCSFLVVFSVFIIAYVLLSVVCVPILCSAKVLGTMRASISDTVLSIVRLFDRQQSKWLQSYICTCIPSRYTWDSMQAYTSRAKPWTLMHAEELNYIYRRTVVISNVPHTSLVYSVFMLSHLVFILFTMYIVWTHLYSTLCHRLVG